MRAKAHRCGWWGRDADGGGSAVQVVVTDPVTGTITATVATTAAMTVDHWYTDPYGNLRGPHTSWPTVTGYLNAPVDTGTGLTRLGVRDYDPTLGRFTTVDPILAPYNPAQNNGYTYAGQRPEEKSFARVEADNDPDMERVGKGEGLVCVSKHYDKTSGLVYYVADGYDKFLREPASPDVFVEDFWPVYALTFNAVESEDELFPPSDVHLIYDMQRDYNTSRQGQREHRKAARPRWTYPNGAIEKEDAEKLANAEPFTATGINLPPGQKLSDMLEPVPVPGVDPNLYEVGQIFSDVTLVVGTNESQFGGTARATATESAIAANASASSDGSSIDDLDAFLTAVARAAGQVLLREMSEETVMRVAGPGAVWPQMTLADISDELFLEVEAGSTGKPNQAVEIQNWTQMMPFLIQLKGIDPLWLARESIRRLDDRVDLTEAVAEGMPSMMAMNHMAQVSTGDPATDPNAQGGEGSANAARPTEEQAGSDASFGSNQVAQAL